MFDLKVSLMFILGSWTSVYNEYSSGLQVAEGCGVGIRLLSGQSLSSEITHLNPCRRKKTWSSCSRKIYSVSRGKSHTFGLDTLHNWSTNWPQLSQQDVGWNLTAELRLGGIENSFMIMFAEIRFDSRWLIFEPSNRQLIILLSCRNLDFVKSIFGFKGSSEVWLRDLTIHVM